MWLGPRGEGGRGQGHPRGACRQRTAEGKALAHRGDSKGAGARSGPQGPPGEQRGGRQVVRTLLGPEAGTLVPREPPQTPPRAPAHTVPRAGAYAGNRPKTVQNPRGFPAAPLASPLPAERLRPSLQSERVLRGSSFGHSHANPVSSLTSAWPLPVSSGPQSQGALHPCDPRRGPRALPRHSAGRGGLGGAEAGRGGLGGLEGTRRGGGDSTMSPSLSRAPLWLFPSVA